MTADLEDEIRRLCDAKRWEPAATAAIRGYGPELLGYLNAMLRDAAEADDVFATACEHVWTGIKDFAWQSSFRTWAYAVTRNACISFVRGPRKKRAAPLGTESLAAIVQEARTRTATYLRTEMKDKLATVRAALDPDDQTLLILRVDRQLSWKEIAQVFEEDPALVDKRASALRKRFERLKDDLREALK